MSLLPSSTDGEKRSKSETLDPAFCLSYYYYDHCTRAVVESYCWSSLKPLVWETIFVPLVQRWFTMGLEMSATRTGLKQKMITGLHSSLSYFVFSAPPLTLSHSISFSHVAGLNGNSGRPQGEQEMREKRSQWRPDWLRCWWSWVRKEVSPGMQWEENLGCQVIKFQGFNRRRRLWRKKRPTQCREWDSCAMMTNSVARTWKSKG